MSKKMRFNTSGAWANFLVGDYLGTIAESRARYRAEWIDSVIVGNLPKWKLRLVQRFGMCRLTYFILPKIEIIHERLIAEFGVQTTIKIGGHTIASRKFKL